MWITHNLNNNLNLPFNVNFNFTEFTVTDFKTESENVCYDLYERYGNNLYLSFSGGSDSEYILKTFNRLKLPITPVIMSCPYNQTDIQAGLNYCKSNNINYEVISFGDEFLELCKQKTHEKGLFSLIGAAPLFVYDAVKDVNGKVVSGQGEPMPITNHKQETFFNSKIEFYDFEFYMDTYTDDQPAPFFCYNQAIFYTYMKEIDRTMNLDDAKCKLYEIPKRKKTYWDQTIYDEIRMYIHNHKLNRIPKVILDANYIIEEMEKHLKRG